MNSSPLQISRREDREAALAWLYEADMTGDAVDEVLRRHGANDGDYSTEIARGVATHRLQIDEAIDAVAEEWTVSRMPGIDRGILRMGVFELIHNDAVPTTAVVSEAVALANQYSTERSAPFVNGVLVKLASLHRTADPAAEDSASGPSEPTDASDVA